MTEHEVIERAAIAFAKQEAMKIEMHKLDAEIRSLTSLYREASRTWITRPEQLKNAVEARIGRKVA